MNPSNPFVLRPQVACAAHELPLEPSDEQWFGPGLDDAVRELVLDEQLKPRGGRMYWAGREPPALRVGLRTGSSVEFRLVGRDDDGDERLIGTVDSSRVFHVAHPGALYLHQGRQWRVDRLDLDDHVAWLEPADDADEYTQTREDTDIAITARGRAGAVRRRVGAPRLGRRDEHDPRLPAQAGVHERDDRGRAARPPTADPADPRVLVHALGRRARRRPGSSRTRCSARCTRPSTR